MQTDDKQKESKQIDPQLLAIENQLKTINKNLLSVFWIVGFFCLFIFWVNDLFHVSALGNA